MADKEITIRVSTEAETQDIEDLKTQIDNLNGTNIKFNTEDVEAELQNLISEAEQLEEELEQAQLNGDDIEADRIADELAEVNSEADRLNEILQTVGETDLSTLTSATEEVNESLEESTEIAITFSDTLSGIDSSTLTEASSNAQDFAQNTEQATSDVEQLSDSMGLIESTMLMDMANQIGALGDQAEGMAQDMNTASISVGQLSTNVGMAEPQMVSLINHISNATFPQEEAMAYVNALNQMGVSADKLGDSATNMDRINDATRTLDYNGVMQLTQGLRSVGIEADNLPSAFNAIAFAEANVSGGAGTLNQVLKRQASTINEYGLNVDQLVVIMQSLSEKGVQGMKMGSELSKVLKDNNGDIQAIEQSLGLEAGALSNASAKTGQYTGKLQALANEEAEHKTFIDQINAGWEDMQLALSPVLNPLMSFVGLIGQFGQLALTTNSIITLCETFGLLKVTEEGVTIAQWTLNASMLANPALWLVIAIVALIGILIYLYYTNEDVRNAIDGLGQAFIQAGQIIYTAVLGIVQWVTDQLQKLWEYITSVGGLIEGGVNITGNKIIDSVIGVMIFFATLPAQIGMIFLNIIAKTLGFGDNFVQNMFNAGVSAVNNFISQIATLPNKVWQEFNEIISNALDFAGRIGQILWDAGANAINNFLNALDRHSPGIMQREFVAEITEMGERVPNVSRNLIKNMGELGDNIVTSFGHPSLNNGNINLNEDSFGNSQISDINGILNNENPTQINYFTFNDTVVDNDERMRKIYEYITKELHWDNKTAGRSKGI